MLIYKKWCTWTDCITLSIEDIVNEEEASGDRCFCFCIWFGSVIT